MNDHDHEDDQDNGHDYSVLELDSFATAIALCEIAQRAKPIATALKQLRKVGRDIAAAEAKLAAVTAQAEQKQAMLAERSAALDGRERTLDERESAFAVSAQDVRDELRQHHNRVEQAHRQLVHRIMSSSGILGNWNFDLQDPPTWQQLRRMIADLPDDLPAPAPEAVTREVTQDWAGNVFVPGSSLTRTIEHKGAA
jgi:hypothetical protein